VDRLAGSICFIAGLLTVTRPDGRWWAAWTAVAAGGACLATSRSFGPLFVLLAVVFVALLVGRTGLRTAVALPRAPAVVAAGVVGAAAAWNVYWELTQQTHPGAGRSDIRPGITDAWEHLPLLGRQAVGVFGAALDVPLPEVIYLTWAALLLGLVGAAIRLGGRRERLVLVATAGAVVLSVFVLAIAVRPTGFPAQARHLLPLALMLPLGAGEVLRRHAAKVSERAARGALLGAVAVAVPVHLTAWYVNARAWSGDPSEPGFLLSDVAYSPPLSWLVWCAALLGAAAAAVAAAWTAMRPSSYG
jgi:hypothetical protein